MKKYLIIFAAFAATMAANAQTPNKKAWEVGLGGSVMQFNRVHFTGFTATEAGHLFDIQFRHAVWGGSLYAAKELSNVFAVDFQGMLGSAEKRWLAHAGLGLQWRLGHYVGSKRIDPYLRAGGNYLYKGFDISYANSIDGMSWQLTNNQNKEGVDGRHFFTVAVGAGVNMWLTDRFGIGLQGDYIAIPKSHVANSLQGTVRLMWRFGKRAARTSAATPPASTPVVEYRDVVVRDTVYIEREKVVEIERGSAFEPIRDIYFDFDSYEIRPGDRDAIIKMASMLKADTSRRYLITGYADARGSAAYDETLSLNRAKAVMQALMEEGVPDTMLKAVGAGKRVANAGYMEEDSIRAGDRKASIELIENEKYWEML